MGDLAAVLFIAFVFGAAIYIPIAFWYRRQVRAARSRWRPPKAAERMTLEEADRLVDQWKAETGYQYHD